MKLEQLKNLSVIKHASVNPGVGKTHWAINTLVDRIQNSEGITLFVAPTLRLLKEVEKDILAKLELKYHVKLHLVKSATASGELTTEKQINKLVIGTTKNAKQSEGTVILCTHTAFALLPHYNNDFGPMFVNRENVSVIYDEARKCTVSENTITLPLNVATVLLNNYLRIDKSVEIPGTKYKLATITHRNTADFDKMFSPTKATRAARNVIDLTIKEAISSANELYISVNLKKDVLDSSNTNIVLQTISVPHLLFSGWKEVVLLSAFFHTSQMYHLLKSKELKINSLKKQSNEFQTTYLKRMAELKLNQNIFVMEDITNQVIEQDRVNLINSRYKQSSITYISPNVSLSKMQLRNGVMINSDLNWDSKTFNDKYKLLAKQRQQVDGEKRLYLKNTLLLIKEMQSEKAQYTPSINDTLLTDHFKTLPGLLINSTPLQWYAKMAVKISKQWYLHNNLPNQKLPITCNKGSGEFNLEIEECLNINDYRFMPFHSQGMNLYKKYDTIAFLATLNPTPEAKRFLSVMCPNYDTELDFTLDQCVQSITRCSVRNTESNSKPLFIVTDKILANKVIKHLGDIITLIEPTFFNIKLKDPFTLDFDDNAKERSAAHKQTDEAKNKAAALHKYLTLHDKNYALMKTASASVSKFKKTGSKLLANEQIKLVQLLAKHNLVKPKLLKSFAVEYYETIKII